MKNILWKSYVVSKIFKMKYIRNYDEKDCFAPNSKNCHFVVVLTKMINIKKTINAKINEIFNEKKFSEMLLNNDITIYENKKTVKKINVIIEKTPQI